MGEKEKKKKSSSKQNSTSTTTSANTNSNKKKKTHPSDPTALFQPTSQVKGLKFGAQFIVKSFTVRRASPLQLLQLLSLPDDALSTFPSLILFIPTNFTILAHHAWHTLTLGLGTKKSKVILFLFESENMKLVIEKLWPSEIALGDVNKKLIRGLTGCEMARFKFRKGAITFYVYAVRHAGCNVFSRVDDLRRVLETVVELKDFVDHTAMLALPDQRSIAFSNTTRC